MFALLPAQGHHLWGQLFGDALETLVNRSRLGSDLDYRLTSHVALQLGLLVVANERFNPAVHPMLFAKRATDIISTLSFESRVVSELTSLGSTNGFVSNQEQSPERVTQGHYGALFGGLEMTHYIDEAFDLLRDRLSRNGIDKSALGGKRVLDSGCGTGRYSHALARLGASEVVGVDFSPENYSKATELNSKYFSNSACTFELADIRQLPFPDESFDVVFSNGVVHHLPEPQVGILELFRVLKSGGWGFFKVMPSPGGLHWDLIELARLVLWDTPFEVAHKYFEDWAIPTNIRYYLLDHMLVPYNTRFSRKDIEMCLRTAGASEVRFLERGADLDRVERIHRNEPYASLRFGEGECRYFFRK